MAVNYQGQATRTRRQMTRSKSASVVVTSMNHVDRGVPRGERSAHIALVLTISKQTAERKSIVYWRQMIRKMTMIGCKHMR